MNVCVCVFGLPMYVKGSEKERENERVFINVLASKRAEFKSI